MKHARLACLVAFLVAAIGTWIHFIRVEREIDPPYSLIDDGLYLGRAVSEPPPGTKAVVNLCGFADKYAVDEVYWRPVLEGGDEPDVEWLNAAVDFIRNQRGQGRIVYVHCLAGMNRSPTVVAAYLMRERNWSSRQAVDFVQTKRPQVQPNPKLMRLLTKFGDEVQTSPAEK